MATTPLLRSETPHSVSVPMAHLGQSLSAWERAALVVSQPVYRISEAVIRAQCTPIQPGVWDNCDNETLERIRRIVTIYGNVHFNSLHRYADVYGFGLTSMPFHGVAGLLNCIENSLNPKDYSHVAGNALESQEKISQPKIMTLNACMFWGGQPISQGGPRAARDRIDQFCQKINEVDPDIFVSQEMSLDPAVKVIDKLKDNYAHFYTNIGPFPWGMESCLFIASKLPIVSAPEFHPFPNQPRIKRGFFCFETPKFWVITTHLQPAFPDVRRKQLEQITSKIDELSKRTSKPCILAGDLNIPYSTDENGEFTTSGLRELYVNNYAKGENPFVLTSKNATWTGLADEYAGSPEPYFINDQRVYWEVDDYALMRKGHENQFSSFDVEILPVIEIDDNEKLVDPANALSDHQGLIISCKIKEDGRASSSAQSGNLIDLDA